MEITREYQIDSIDEGQQRLGISANALEIKAGLKQGTINDLRRGKTQVLRADKWDKLSRALQLITTIQIPILGRVGAGAEVFPIDDYAPGNASEYTDLPPGVEYSDELYALRVEGDSQAPMLFEGWLVFAKRRIEGGCDDLTSKVPHIVKIKDGPTLLKLIRRGYTKGKYNLRSHNADDIDDVELEWCAKVEAIVPK